MKNLRWQMASHVRIGEENVIRVITPSGEIEISEWIKKAEDLAKDNEEEYILEKLYEFCRKETPWLKMKEFQVRKDIDDLEEKEMKRELKRVEEEKEQYKKRLERDIKELALQYYCSRIWEDSKWVCHKLFNDFYLEGELQLQMI